MQNNGSPIAESSAAVFNVNTAAVLRAAVHDLKGPASRLRVLTGLIQRDEASLNDNTKALLRNMSASTEALNVTVEALRIYAEISSRDLKLEAIELSEALAAAIHNCDPQIRSSEARVTYDTLPQVRGDRFLLAWLFEELLTNAIRFRGGAAPQIHIRADRAEPGICMISVADNGPGIQPEFLERAFQPFRTLSDRSGAGIGLTICRQIVNQHGGSIWAQAGSGGADIRFTVVAGG
jgi:signal transduction histidine kinase